MKALCLWLAILFPWQGDLPQLSPKSRNSSLNASQIATISSREAAQTDRTVQQWAEIYPLFPAPEKYVTTGS